MRQDNRNRFVKCMESYKKQSSVAERVRLWRDLKYYRNPSEGGQCFHYEAMRLSKNILECIAQQVIKYEDK